MSIEKNINGRIIHKHDTEINWNKATAFIPKQGELIIYDIDDNYLYERFKIGDGITSINNLPFSIDIVLNSFELITINDIDIICSAEMNEFGFTVQTAEYIEEPNEYGTTIILL